MIAMTIMIFALGLVSALFAKAMSTRQRESSRTDALTAAQAALNVISREIANSGYGIAGNGIVIGDSTSGQIHFQSNIKNDNTVFNDPGENITYYFDGTTQSILRHDPNAYGPNRPQTSTIVNRISSLGFEYFDYVGTNPPIGPNPTPTVNTARVRVTVSVLLEQVVGQGNPQSIVLVSDVTLRNSDYALRQY